MSRDGVRFAVAAGLVLAGVTAAANAYVPADHPLCGDEAHFVETVRLFGAGFTWRKLRTYEEMSTPLPFLVYAAWGGLFGFDLPTLRWGNCLAGWLACLAVYRLAGSAGLGRAERRLMAVWFAAIPYTLYLSAFVHTDMVAVLALACGLTGVVRGRWVVAGAWLAAAVLSRQYLVFAPVGVVWYGFWRARRRGDRRAAAGAVLTAALAAAPAVALFAYWGGAHPANRLHTIYSNATFTFHPESLAVYLAVIPVYLAPYFAREFVRVRPRGWEIGAGLAAGTVPVFAPLGPSDPPGETGATGLFHRLTRMSGSPSLEQAAFALGLGLSALAVVRAVRGYRAGGPARDEIVLWDLLTLAFLAIMPFSYLHWEKYLLPLIPVLALRMSEPLSAGRERELA